jgi:hypothetical protein
VHFVRVAALALAVAVLLLGLALHLAPRTAGAEAALLLAEDLSQRALTPAMLIEEASALAGQQVTVIGEVIGPVLRRGAFCWINLGQNGSAIGIWVRAEQAAQVGSGGGYGKKGDTVAATGILRTSCSEHGGELDFHADALAITAKGGYGSSRLRFDSWPAAIVMMTAGVLCLFLARRRTSGDAD